MPHRRESSASDAATAASFPSPRHPDPRPQSGGSSSSSSPGAEAAPAPAALHAASRRSAPSFAAPSLALAAVPVPPPAPSPHMMAMPPSSPPTSAANLTPSRGPGHDQGQGQGPAFATARERGRAGTPALPHLHPPRRARSQTPRHTSSSLEPQSQRQPRRDFRTAAALHQPPPPRKGPQQFRSASAQPHHRPRSSLRSAALGTARQPPSPPTRQPRQHRLRPGPQSPTAASALAAAAAESSPSAGANHLQPAQHPRPVPPPPRRLDSSSGGDADGGGGSVRSAASGTASSHQSSTARQGRDGGASGGGGDGRSGSGGGFRLRKAHSAGGAAGSPPNPRFGGSDREPPAAGSSAGSGSGGGGFRRNSSKYRRWSEDGLAQHAKACRRVLDDLSRAQGSERRIAALTHVCECFDHTDEAKHNLELGHGAVLVLTKTLQVATYDDEIRMMVSALEMVLRGSPRDVELAYSMLGSHIYIANNPTTTASINSSSPAFPAAPLPHHHLLPTLFRILDRCEANAMKLAGVSILNIAKILFHLSRCPELRLSLGHQAGVLESLQRVAAHLAPTIPPSAATAAGDGTTTTTYSALHHAEVRLYRLRTLANLANVDDNKVLLVEHHHGALVEGLVRVAHWDPDDNCRQCAASAIMDLASEPNNQVKLAHDDTVLGTLVKMTLVETQGATREFAITALQNLAFCKDNRSRLVNFKGGALLEALQQALSSDWDAKARRRAAGALTNLVCDETARFMGEHRGLLEALALVATKDDNWDVQTRASLALTKIANCLTIDMDCHEALLDALVVASLSKAENSVSAVFRVKARNPENRQVLARHPGVIDTLADLCLSGGVGGGGGGAAVKASDRDNAVRALMHLVNEPTNRTLICQQPHVLDALVAGANYDDPDLEEARDSAVRALERLATEPSNRPTLARHPGLLTAVAAAVEREAVWEDEARGKERKAQHGRFAKPLLMSLLVAM